jgi:hypothetical protein
VRRARLDAQAFDAQRRDFAALSRIFPLTPAAELRHYARHHRRGTRNMIGTDFLFMERLMIGGLLAALAVAVAFGPELRQAAVRLRRREPVERRTVGLDSTSS